MTLSNGQWRTILAVITAVVAYLLIQTDVTLLPWAKVALGAIAVACAAIKVPEGDTTVPPAQ